MIQVLERIDKILKILSGRPDMTLGEIAAEVNIKKTTLSNILKSLKELEYIQKDLNGRYSFGSRLKEFCKSDIQKESIVILAQNITHQTSRITKEFVICSVLDSGAAVVIARSECKQHISANIDSSGILDMYSSASGRVFLAHLDEKDCEDYIRKHPVTCKSVSKKEDIRKALEKIRSNGIESVCAGGHNEITAMAVPVFGPDKKIWAAIGLVVPSMRYKGKHKALVNNELKKAGRHMSALLSHKQGL